MFAKVAIATTNTGVGDKFGRILRLRSSDYSVTDGDGLSVESVQRAGIDLVVVDRTLDPAVPCLCEQLKSSPATSLVPIIMLVNQPIREQVTGKEIVADAYLYLDSSTRDIESVIEEVVKLRESRSRERVEAELAYRFQSEIDYLDEIIKHITSLWFFDRFPTKARRHFILAIREMGINAIEWGHQNQRERIVSMKFTVYPDRMVVHVEDTGTGFDPERLPHAADRRDPLKHFEIRQANGLREGGFGIMMTRGLVDELSYNITGNMVRLIKYYPDCEK